MENAVDALKMAGAVLLFLMAISVSIVAFGMARQASDDVLDMSDRETVYINGDYYYETTGFERSVSLETIIPAIYRAYSEQYKIVFDFQDGSTDPIFTYTNARGEEQERNSIDLEFDNNLITNEDRISGYATFLNAIIYGVKDEHFNDWYYTPNKKISIPEGNSLYKRLSNSNQIIEYLGVYYPSETATEEVETTVSTNVTEDEIPDANKQEKRIITYVVK